MVEAPRILLVGSEARIHALGWKLKQDNANVRLYFAPGNAGTSQIGHNIEYDPRDINGITGFAAGNMLDLVVVGPERPIVEGITDALTEEKVDVFGPSQAASFLEADKAEAALFMRHYGIPQPDFHIFTDHLAALEYLRGVDPRSIVIKASGLADGKGVVLPDNMSEAIETIMRMMVEGKYIFGGKNAGAKVVIQERLEGTEVSVIGFVSNEIGLLVPAQDYKRAYDGDKGPITGGMGAYAPNRHLSREGLEEIYDTILAPTRDGMIDRGTPFRGALFVGLMLTAKGPKVLEYNVRFGDPETQAQMRLLQSNLYHNMRSTMAGRLSADQIRSSNKAAVGIVLASGGYPGKYEIGKRISGLDRTESGIVHFHGGTRINPQGEIETSGGRVLTVTAIGESLEQAARRANRAADIISFEGKERRRDIAA